MGKCAAPTGSYWKVLGGHRQGGREPRAIIETVLNLLLRLAVTVIALRGADLLLPDFNFSGGWAPLIAFAIVLGLLNWIVKPILVFLSIPFLIITIGLFYFVVNALVLYMASMLLPGVLHATNAGIFFGSLLVSFFHWILAGIFRLNKKDHE